MYHIRRLFYRCKNWIKENPARATCAILGALIVGGIFTGGMLFFAGPLVIELFAALGAIAGGGAIGGAALISLARYTGNGIKNPFNPVVAGCVGFVTSGLIALCPPVGLAFAGTFFSLLGAYVFERIASACINKGWFSGKKNDVPAAGLEEGAEHSRATSTAAIARKAGMESSLSSSMQQPGAEGEASLTLEGTAPNPADIGVAHEKAPLLPAVNDSSDFSPASSSRVA